MLGANILEPIINASQIAADRFLKVAGYDKTLECTILEQDKDNPEIYYVSTNGFSRLMVYAQKNAPIYNINSTVLVNIPEGNFDREKFIIGEVVNENDKFKINDPKDNFISLCFDEENNIYSKELWKFTKSTGKLGAEYLPPSLRGQYLNQIYSVTNPRTNTVLFTFSLSINNGTFTDQETNFYRIVDADKTFIEFNIESFSLTSQQLEIKTYYWPLSNYFGNINNVFDKNFSLMFSVPRGYYITRVFWDYKNGVPIKICPIKSNITDKDIKDAYCHINVKGLEYGFNKADVDSFKLNNGLYLDYCLGFINNEQGEKISIISPVIYYTLKEQFIFPSSLKLTNTGSTYITNKLDVLWLLRYLLYPEHCNFNIIPVGYDEVKDIELIPTFDEQLDLQLLWDINQLTQDKQEQSFSTQIFYYITAEHLTKSHQALKLKSQILELKE